MYKLLNKSIYLLLFDAEDAASDDEDDNDDGNGSDYGY